VAKPLFDGGTRTFFCSLPFRCWSQARVAGRPERATVPTKTRAGLRRRAVIHAEPSRVNRQEPALNTRKINAPGLKNQFGPRPRADGHDPECLCPHSHAPPEDEQPPMLGVAVRFRFYADIPVRGHGEPSPRSAPLGPFCDEFPPANWSRLGPERNRCQPRRVAGPSKRFFIQHGIGLLPTE